MKFIDLFRLSTRMFKARTSRTLLTVLGMGIGIGAILFLVSLGYGLQKTLLERITTSESLLTLDVAESKSGLVSLSKDVVKNIEEMENVAEVSPAFQLTAQGHLENLSADISVIGIKPSFLRLGGIKIEQGEELKDAEPEGVVVANSIAQVFGMSLEDMLGKEVSFTFFIPEDNQLSENSLTSNFKKIESDKKYKIVGNVESEENIIYLNSSSLENIEINRYTQLKVKAKDSDTMGAIRDTILEKGLLVASLSDTVDQANQIFKIIQLILMLFGIIALIVSAIGMFNTMTIALLERTEEIGIMKSIGASDRAISMMFVMEASVMGFLGGLGGVGIGILGGRLFNVTINFIASHFGGEAVSLFYSPLWFVVVIIVFAGFVGFITGFIPARRASKIDPLDALRYK
ncbi:MAG: hypothetical protein COU40_02575 [Candidatus Moranbacteria bacterium CG10_big_fil_rev_8_21_14_0_10_35_21]|nr:MAG: hypothetical protein COU40_02575 [Candidatus Moranbacteria bacterium CG10_big_fil_rev_8_21_14_0_10_35_21]PJA88896.1 MAG: hypothetical protein CO139_00740 [Candidatus Moranbacteria bacterium CG_4_9_14_3_um_filter_36_9]